MALREPQRLLLFALTAVIHRSSAARCSGRKQPARGDLFEHMNDPTAHEKPE